MFFLTRVNPEKMRGMGFALLWSSIGLISLPALWLGAQLASAQGGFFFLIPIGM